MSDEYAPLYRDFLKSELLSISEELGISVREETTSKILVQNIIKDLDTNGVPETEDCSEVLMQFLYSAGYIDEDGELLGELSDEEQLPEVDNSDYLQEDKPKCFGFEDERDPACRGCAVQNICRKQRIINRPACFGRLYLKSDENCIACIENPFCKAALEAAKGQ